MVPDNVDLDKVYYIKFKNDEEILAKILFLSKEQSKAVLHLPLGIIMNEDLTYEFALYNSFVVGEEGIAVDLSDIKIMEVVSNKMALHAYNIKMKEIRAVLDKINRDYDFSSYKLIITDQGKKRVTELYLSGNDLISSWSADFQSQRLH